MDGQTERRVGCFASRGERLGVLGDGTRDARWGWEFGRAYRTVRSSARTRPATVFLVVIVILRRWRSVEGGERRERRGSGGHLGAAGTRDFLRLEWEDETKCGRGEARAHRDVSRGSDAVSVYLVRRVVVVVVVERAAGVRPVPDARGPARGSGDRRSAVSEAAHDGRGGGYRDVDRGRGERAKRAGTHSAPHVHLLWPTWRPRMGRSSVDIAAPRALTVRRATCERPRSPRPPLCNRPSGGFTRWQS